MLPGPAKLRYSSRWKAPPRTLTTPRPARARVAIALVAASSTTTLPAIAAINRRFGCRRRVVPFDGTTGSSQAGRDARVPTTADATVNGRSPQPRSVGGGRAAGAACDQGSAVSLAGFSVGVVALAAAQRVRNTAIAIAIATTAIVM